MIREACTVRLSARRQVSNQKLNITDETNENQKRENLGHGEAHKGLSLAGDAKDAASLSENVAPCPRDG